MVQRGIVSKLVIGIKRLRFRANDARREAADKEYKAVRPGFIERSNGRCLYCNYSSKRHNEVHHLDDDHHNNAPSNFAIACRACHPYQHIGEPSKAGDMAGEGLGSKTLLAAIPEVSAQDMNHLQRAIGTALLDPIEAHAARAILEHLVEERCRPVKEVWETCLPINFAAALAQLNPQEYQQREASVGHLRIVFNEGVLEQFGRQMLLDYPALPVKSWEGVASDVGRKIQTNAGV